MGLFDRWSEPDGDGGDEGSPFAGRGFVASAIVVGALVVCALVWIFSRGDGEPSPITQPSMTTMTPAATPTRDPVATPEPTRTPTTAPPATPAAGGCKNPDPDRRLPLAAPRDVTWTFDGGLMIPLQPAGPDRPPPTPTASAAATRTHPPARSSRPWSPSARSGTLSSPSR